MSSAVETPISGGPAGQRIATPPTTDPQCAAGGDRHPGGVVFCARGARVRAVERGGPSIPVDVLVHSSALFSDRAGRGNIAWRVGRRDLDVCHLCVHSCRSHSSRIQCTVAVAFRECSGSPIWGPAFSCLLRGDGGGRCGSASCDPCWRVRAGGWGLGGDLRHDGGRHSICIPARRSARVLARSERERRIWFRQHRSWTRCATAACSRFLGSGSG